MAGYGRSPVACDRRLRIAYRPIRRTDERRRRKLPLAGYFPHRSVSVRILRCRPAYTYQSPPPSMHTYYRRQLICRGGNDRVYCAKRTWRVASTVGRAGWRRVFDCAEPGNRARSMSDRVVEERRLFPLLLLLLFPALHRVSSRSIPLLLGVLHLGASEPPITRTETYPVYPVFTKITVSCE